MSELPVDVVLEQIDLVQRATKREIFADGTSRLVVEESVIERPVEVVFPGSPVKRQQPLS